MSPESRDYLLDDPRVHPRARVRFKRVLALLRSGGYPIIVIEVYRSPTRQRMLYAAGRSDEVLRRVGYTKDEIAMARRAGYTAARAIVTRSLKTTMHGRGRAMDCAFVQDGKVSYNVPDAWWSRYGATAKAHGLIWGGDWKSLIDKPHVEYRGE